jgi:uncharacterized protein (TIGR03790 family)
MPIPPCPQDLPQRWFASLKLSPNQGLLQQWLQHGLGGTALRLGMGLVGATGLATGLASCSLVGNRPPVHQPLKRQELAIVVNTDDPLSVAIADYYQQRRGIPPENRIEIAFPRYQTTLSAASFRQLKAEVDRQTSPRIQAYALTWAQPYRVDCMSITAAFSFGFDEAHCAQGCAATAPNPYFNAQGGKPKDYGLRLTMAIAATQFYQATALINRGALAQGQSQGQFWGQSQASTAYLLSTSDRARNVRAQLYPQLQAILGPLAAQHGVSIQLLAADGIRDRPDVMFYFTGTPQVPDLQSNHFRPGAMADHLTSLGGMLTDSGQMSSLKWLEAGATGSYGTVVEPCNFPQKFPHPGIAMGHYLNGDTLIEAYWKSVAWPGQGIFIGDPLAQPFR